MDNYYSEDTMQEISDILSAEINTFIRPPYDHDHNYKEAIKSFGDWLAAEIDKAILDELIEEVERDKEIVESILPKKLFEV